MLFQFIRVVHTSACESTPAVRLVCARASLVNSQWMGIASCCDELTNRRLTIQMLVIVAGISEAKEILMPLSQLSFSLFVHVSMVDGVDEARKRSTQSTLSTRFGFDAKIRQIQPVRHYHMCINVEHGVHDIMLLCYLRGKQSGCTFTPGHTSIKSHTLSIPINRLHHTPLSILSEFSLRSMWGSGTANGVCMRAGSSTSHHTLFHTIV